MHIAHCACHACCVCVCEFDHIWLTHSFNICTFLRDNFARQLSIIQHISIFFTRMDRSMAAVHEIINRWHWISCGICAIELFHELNKKPTKLALAGVLCTRVHFISNEWNDQVYYTSYTYMAIKTKRNSRKKSK